MIVSLDLAKTAGIAWYNPEKQDIYVTEIVGTPIEQFEFLQELCKYKRDVTILIEQFVYFAKSVKTQASLQERIGYIKYAAENKGWNVETLNLNSVRAKYFKGKQKKQQCLDFFRQNHNHNFTDNMSDAVLQLCYYKDWNINNVTIRLV